jgi:transcriptional regulator with XRE-family HTH domain
VVDLSSIRHAAGVTQVQLAAALNTSQGQISRIERQSDMLLSTLSAYLTALGVSARLTITVKSQAVEYDLTGRPRKRRVNAGHTFADM